MFMTEAELEDQATANRRAYREMFVESMKLALCVLLGGAVVLPLAYGLFVGLNFLAGIDWEW